MVVYMVLSKPINQSIPFVLYSLFPKYPHARVLGETKVPSISSRLTTRTHLKNNIFSCRPRAQAYTDRQTHTHKHNPSLSLSFPFQAPRSLMVGHRWKEASRRPKPNAGASVKMTVSHSLTK